MNEVVAMRSARPMLRKDQPQQHTDKKDLHCTQYETPQSALSINYYSVLLEKYFEVLKKWGCLLPTTPKKINPSPVPCAICHSPKTSLPQFRRSSVRVRGTCSPSASSWNPPPPDRRIFSEQKRKRRMNIVPPCRTPRPSPLPPPNRNIHYLTENSDGTWDSGTIVGNGDASVISFAEDNDVRTSNNLKSVAFLPALA